MFIYCPNCDNILDVSKNQPKAQNKNPPTSPTSLSDSENESDTVSSLLLQTKTMSYH